MSTLKTSLVVLLILIAGITVAAASISVKNIAITPVGDLVSGQKPPNPVTAIFTIDFNPTGGETFPSGETLTMSTDLENGQWSYITSLDGNPNPAVTANGRNLNINGWVLSYPSKRELSMKVTLNGEVPTVTTSGNKTIIRVAELSGKSEAVSGSEVIRERYVINPADKTKAISDVKIALTAFRALIDEKAQAGIETTGAMEKYSAANTAISNAEKSSSFSAAQTYLTNAQVLLKDGQAALDRAMAQQVINEAQTPIDQTDGLITYFKVNRSMGNDPRLAQIIQKRDRAADLLSEANDLLPKNDFTGAKDKAVQSSDMAKESYNAALVLRKDIGEANPLDSVTKGIGGIFGGAASGLGSILIYIVIIVVIAVVIVVGIVLYRRRRTDWDELA
ncbi:MAG: hypothetical protein NTV68_08425 [Methanomicrobiales archaeon]|nr:hypothetical protein [Methanomicrobiales archaeon]